MAGSIGPVIDPDPNYPQYHTLNFEAGEYYAQLSFVELNVDFTGTVNFTAKYRDKKTSNVKQYLYGGGVRVNSISYYDRPDQYAGNQIPAKKMNFSYSDIAGSGKSSGALLFPKPIHHYEYSYNNAFVYAFGLGYSKYDYSNSFTIFSSQNFIPIQKTRGADVGYQDVTVYETGKGESVYTYTSPIDQPNPDQVSSTFPPFVPVANYDYRRGLLMNEQKKDNNAVLQYKKSTQYNTYDTEKLTGISLRHVGSPYTEYIYAGHFNTYDAYILGCLNSNPSVWCGSGDPAGMIAMTANVEIVGKANQTHIERNEFFPNGNSIKTLEDITYNTRDYPIKQATTFADNSVKETTYNYAHEKGNQLMIDKNMIGFPLETITTQTSNGVTKTISRAETVYSTSVPTIQTGSLVLPLSVKSYDIQTNIPLTEVTYDKYDLKGKLQQYTTKDGVSTVIIWGYNQTQPIAKTEGAKLSDIQQSMIDTIVNASNTDASATSNNDETALLQALDSFRNNLLNVQITTYTYDPLIGVRTITPPSGIREVYLYDTANRLREIRENNQTGKLLKEFKYNYKN
jgi:hypothetical protein